MLCSSRSRRSVLSALLAAGFDLSKIGTIGVSVRCSQCAALVINGVPCHESGCPHKPTTPNPYMED